MKGACRYAPHTFKRALEIFYGADCDRSPREIAADLLAEGHGEVAETAIARWLGEEPALHAVEAIALCQRLRSEAATADGKALVRIIAASNDVADHLTAAYERACEAIPKMKLETADDLMRVVAILRHLSLASLESLRFVTEMERRRSAESFVSIHGHA